MPGFINLSAHLSAPQGLTRLTNVRFFDYWAFLGLTSLKCTLILAGRPGGGVWGVGASPGRPGASLSTYVHVSSQGHLGLMYRSCFDSGFGWFNLHRFLFTLSAKTIKTPWIWNFESTFSEGALLTMSVVVFRVKVNAFPQNLGGSIYLDFCLPCQPKQSKHLGFGTLKSTFSDGALFTMSVVMYRAKVTWV